MSPPKRLKIIAGKYKDSSIPLTYSPLTIGRSDDNSVVLAPETSASRHHVEFAEDGGAWTVRDLGSLNGTYVNGERIEWPRNLHLGDKIKIATEMMVFEEDSGDGSEGVGPTLSSAVPVSTKAGSSTVILEGRVGTTLAAQDTGPDGRTTSAGGSVPDELGEDAAAQLRVLVPQLESVVAEIGKAIVGQKEILHGLMLALMSRGHVLMIGLPGLAKTLMIRTLAEVLDLRFRRIQFTPDLMPADITGTDVLEVDEASGRKNYRFIRGPVFTNILLADEINRTPPKTQAALLEAMQESHVTAAGETYPLAPPFFVLATQNPLEQEGTYPLPEAQLDRFMFSLRVNYPSEAEEEEIAESTTSDRAVELRKRMSGAEILQLQRLVRRLPVSKHVIKYATRLARATRPADPRAPEAVKKWVHCGAGPRATQYLLLAAKAGAIMRGSLVVNCNDVRLSALPVLRHRMFTNFAADSQGVDVDDIITQVLQAVHEPGEHDYQMP
ncbi:MAG: FHA domain-containing protein [Verrucomicrobia bacterium]|nr:MAG: FHA domain-containing protein [Verrucomicrobiota bacterium]